MIIMNLELDNLFGFNDFKMNFSYPKKIVNSSVPDEFLQTKPNFRYKKLNILLGANASGKTSIGKAMMTIFNFISKKDPERIVEYVRNKNEKANFSIDFLNNEKILYRITCEIKINNELSKEESSDKKAEENIEVLLDIFSANISKTDSYESCVKKLKKIDEEDEIEKFDYVQKLKKIPSFGWFFTFPDVGANTVLMDDDILNLNILNSVLQTLDTDITGVVKSKELEKSYIIKSKNGDIFIQDGEIVNKNILSSGTKMGIDIAYIISSICKNSHGFYYCDEKFSFIQTDVEQSILSLMISLLKKNTQLFFTSHNLDLLDLGLPIHSFAFLKKCSNIEVVYPEKIIKKNDISLRNAVKNDIFNISPDISKILDLEDRCLYEEN